MSDLFSILPQIAGDPGPWVLVTLVRAEGSTYRKAGAHLLVSPARHIGMLSGGCLEADVAARCAPLFNASSEPLEMVIDTRRLLGCDGQLTLLAEPLPEALPSWIDNVLTQRRNLSLHSSRPGPQWKPTSLEVGARDFSHEVLPPLRLGIFGSGPGALPLKQMSGVLGWEAVQWVLASDPASRYPSDAWSVLPTASAILRSSWVDERSACILMNHHVGRDADLLAQLWNSPTPFLGLLGSRRRRDQILGRLAFETALDLSVRELYAPVGIDLGAEGASEIALEICSQVQRVFAEQAVISKEPTAIRTLSPRLRAI